MINQSLERPEDFKIYLGGHRHGARTLDKLEKEGYKYYSVVNEGNKNKDCCHQCTGHELLVLKAWK